MNLGEARATLGIRARQLQSLYSQRNIHPKQIEKQMSAIFSWQKSSNADSIQRVIVQVEQQIEKHEKLLAEVQA